MTDRGISARVDHVGIAVPSISEAEPTLAALGCEKRHEVRSHDGALTRATYALGDASRIELVAPAEGESFLTDFLDREGPGLHHLTVEVADVDAAVASLESADVEVVDRADHDRWTEAVVSPRNATGALIQLVEYREDEGDSEDGPVGDGQPTAVNGVADEVADRIASDPYCRTLGVELRALGEGTATTALPVTEDLLNFHGTPHGGAVYSLADAAFAAASNSYGETALALETNISYLDAADVGDTLVAKATETHRSRRTAEYEVVVRAERQDETTVGDRVATFRGRVYRP